jgi:hypothetical protein
MLARLNLNSAGRCDCKSTNFICKKELSCQKDAKKGGIIWKITEKCLSLRYISKILSLKTKNKCEFIL